MFGSQRKQSFSVGKRGGPGQGAAMRVAGDDFGAEQIGVADELGDVGSGRTVVDFAGRGDLFEFSRAKKRDAVGHDHRFFLIVGDEDEGDSDLALERLQFDLHLTAEVGVERGERFIEKKKARAIYKSAGEGDALLLAAADLGGLFLGVRVHFYLFESFGDALGDFVVRALCHAQSVGDVLLDCQVREERVVLEDCVHLAFVGRKGIEAVAFHPEFAGGGVFESGDDAEERGFSRAAFAEDGEEFAFGDVESDVAEDDVLAKGFGDVLDFEQGGFLDWQWGFGESVGWGNHAFIWKQTSGAKAKSLPGHFRHD